MGTNDNEIKIQEFTGGMYIEGLKDLSYILPKAYQFNPQKDITAYELAECLKYCLGRNGSGLESEPETIKRHWTEL